MHTLKPNNVLSYPYLSERVSPLFFCLKSVNLAVESLSISWQNLVVVLFAASRDGEGILMSGFIQSPYLLFCFYTAVITHEDKEEPRRPRQTAPLFHSRTLNLHLAISVSEAEVLTEFLIVRPVHSYTVSTSGLTVQNIQRQEEMDFSEIRTKTRLQYLLRFTSFGQLVSVYRTGRANDAFIIPYKK